MAQPYKGYQVDSDKKSQLLFKDVKRHQDVAVFVPYHFRLPVIFSYEISARG
jgi:hypothetical protein